MEKPELKPCPFCGGEAHMNGCGNTWWVSCDTEGCVCQIGGKLQHTELQAVKAWNKRAKENDG